MKKVFFISILIFSFFCLQCNTNEKNSSKTIHVDNQSKKFKYAIFDICNSFWKKNLHDILLSYREKSNISVGYFDLIKYGIKYAFGTLDAKKGYEVFFKHCKQMNKNKIEEICKGVWEDECKNFILKEASERFKKYKEDGTITILIDTGIEELYSEFIKVYKFDYVITSKLEFDKNNLTTGKLLGQPCSGKEKYKKAKELIEEKLQGSLTDSVFYANSYNDRFLIEKVGKTFIVNPNSKLKKYAKKNNLEILNFKETIKN